MSRTTHLLAALGGAALGATGGAGVLALLAGRSRPAIEGFSALNPPVPMPPARILTLPDRGELFVRDQPGPDADSPTVVLLHGWVVSADLNWFTSYAPLAAHARVLAPDHRGHGRGTRHSHPFRLEDVADDVAAMLRELGTGPAIIVGYSMGGPIAQLVWQRHPDLVAGLVLCATASQFRFGSLGGAHWRLMGLYQLFSRLLPRTWLERILLAQVEGRAPIRIIRMVGPELDDLKRMLPWAVGEFERGDVEDRAEAGRQLGRFDSRGWLPGLDVPAAMILTTRDRLVAPTAQLELAALAPHSLLLEVEADHDAPSAVPRAFNDALVQAVTHILRTAG
jgi:pimeloyl-ACP methyl ester carboxylesterase